MCQEQQQNTIDIGSIPGGHSGQQAAFACAMHFTSAAPQSVACGGGTAGGMLPDLASLPFLTGRSAPFGALLRYRFLVERVTIVLIEESTLKDFVTALVEMMPGGQSLDISIWLAGPGNLCGVCQGCMLLMTCWYQPLCTKHPDLNICSRICV